MRIASIDIGTNSLILLVVQIMGDKITPIYEEVNEPRLGYGYGKTGEISDIRVQKAIEYINKYIRITQDYNVDSIKCCGTEIFRKAKNGKQISQTISRVCGLPVKIISAEEEARMTYMGAISDLADKNNPLVIDIGGGSTELIDKNGVYKSISFPIGAVNLTEEVSINLPLSLPMKRLLRKRILEAISEKKFERKRRKIIGVGGTITTIAAYLQDLDEYIPEKIHNFVIKSEDLGRVISQFEKNNLQQLKKKIVFAPNRADILPAGTYILLELLRLYNAHQITVSERGLRWGIIINEQK